MRWRRCWGGGGGVQAVGVEVTGPRGRSGSPCALFSPPSLPATLPWPRAGEGEGSGQALRSSQWDGLRCVGKETRLRVTGGRRQHCWRRLWHARDPLLQLCVVTLRRRSYVLFIVLYTSCLPGCCGGGLFQCLVSCSFIGHVQVLGSFSYECFTVWGRVTYRHRYLGTYTPYLPSSRGVTLLSISVLATPSATLSPRRRSLARPSRHRHGRRVVMSHAFDHARKHRLAFFFAGGSRETNLHLAPPPDLSFVELPDGRRLPHSAPAHAPRSLNSLTPYRLHHVLPRRGATWPSE